MLCDKFLIAWTHFFHHFIETASCCKTEVFLFLFHACGWSAEIKIIAPLHRPTGVITHDKSQEVTAYYTLSHNNPPLTRQHQIAIREETGGWVEMNKSVGVSLTPVSNSADWGWWWWVGCEVGGQRVSLIPKGKPPNPPSPCRLVLEARPPKIEPCCSVAAAAAAAAAASLLVRDGCSFLGNQVEEL